MRDFLPAVAQSIGTYTGEPLTTGNLYNAIPIVLDGGGIGVYPRGQFTSQGNAPTGATDRGRGVFAFAAEDKLYLDEDTYFYNGGSQDLTSTSSPGFAGNLGFNEEYLASFVPHKVSGSVNMAIVNAGHSSTHASANHGNLWYVADGASAPVSVSDANMPGNNGISITRGGASLDGYFFLCDIKGQIHNSNLNDVTTWGATDFLTANRAADIGVYLGSHHDNVVYIGTQSIEFFYNAGNASGSPLARRQDVAYRFGSLTPNGILEVGDIIYFLGVDEGGFPRVFALENFQVRVISTPRIDQLLADSGIKYNPDITTVDALAFRGHMSYFNRAGGGGLILSLGNTRGTHYWDQTTGIWSYWFYGEEPTYSGTYTWTEQIPVISSNGLHTAGGSFFQFVNGQIAGFDNTVGVDTHTGAPINDLSSTNNPDSYIVFDRWDGGTDRKKRVLWARIVTDPLASSGLGTAVDATLKWLDYDRTTTDADGQGLVAPDDFTVGRSFDLNIRGQRQGRLGTTRQRSFLLQFGYSGPASIVKGIEFEYEVVGE